MSTKNTQLNPTEPNITQINPTQPNPTQFYTNQPSHLKRDKCQLKTNVNQKQISTKNKCQPKTLNLTQLNPT